MSDHSSNKIVIALMLASIAKESRGAYMTARKDAIAYATFTDTYAGAIGAELRAYKTRRNGLNIMRYRWQTVRGGSCGLLAFDSAKGAMLAAMATARNGHTFTSIHIMISAKSLFE